MSALRDLIAWVAGFVYACSGLVTFFCFVPLLVIAIGSTLGVGQETACALGLFGAGLGVVLWVLMISQWMAPRSASMGIEAARSVFLALPLGVMGCFLVPVLAGTAFPGASQVLALLIVPAPLAAGGSLLVAACVVILLIRLNREAGDEEATGTRPPAPPD